MGGRCDDPRSRLLRAQGSEDSGRGHLGLDNDDKGGEPRKHPENHGRDTNIRRWRSAQTPTLFHCKADRVEKPGSRSELAGLPARMPVH